MNTDNLMDILKRISYALIDYDSIESEIIRMKRPGFFGENFSKTSLSDGLLSICMLFSELDYLFPNEKWDEKAHEYLSKVLDDVKLIGFDISMCNGFTGMGLVVNGMSKNETQYIKLLSSINDIIIKLANDTLDKTDMKKGVSYLEYDVLYGLAGVLNYLLLFSKKDKYIVTINRIVDVLIGLTKDIHIDNYNVPAFYLSPEKYMYKQEKEAYPRGSFNTGLAHGMAGVIVALSKAIKYGISKENIEDAIDRLVKFIQKSVVINNGKRRVKGIISLEEYVNGRVYNNDFERDAWCYGNPGVCYTVIMAGCELKREDYITWGLGLLKDTLKDIKGIFSPIFCHGYAGILCILTAIDNKLNKNIFSEERIALREKILSYYDEDYVFGFKDYTYNEKGTLDANKSVGLIEGTTGIVLALLYDKYNIMYTNWGTFFGIYQ